MTLRFPLAASDDTFLATAARRYVHTVDIPRVRKDVWDLLTADDALVSWSAVITGSKWLSARPFGIGTTRLVTLGGAVRLEERFYRWDEGERMTFTVDAASIPGLHRFAEDLVLRPTPQGTRLTWTFALEGRSVLQPLLGLASPVNNIVTRTIAQGITTKAQQEAEQ
ncbi:SRPBCC family protein [Nocardia macrotermitis]|uniref:Polyketide cyclase / dehydrase and lipid transport n=1 Tax=Nocardia macrotermitis TaxID=2585198 RepID=A0A7K0CXX6_9NOCA|nr:SRPBCC family protein [Nocardia macrotermitis]MQY18360.1 hypothetical protein [Nocardia macrotermitis]